MMGDRGGMPRWGLITMSAVGIVGTRLFFVAAAAPNLPMYGDSLVDYVAWAPTHQTDAHQEVTVIG